MIQNVLARFVSHHSFLAPMDYTAIDQERIIPAGTTQFEINISIKNDRVAETDETFKVHLSLPDEPTLCIPDTIVSIISE